MLEDNAVWLVYIYGIYPQFGWVIVFASIILGIYITVVGVALLFSITKDQVAQSTNMAMKFKWVFIVPMIVIVANTFIPSRDTLVMMFSAKPIIQTAKSIGDSNTTKSLVTILENSVKIIENKSKEMLKEK